MKMEPMDMTMTEVDRRFIAAQAAVAELQKQVALQQFDLLRTLHDNTLLRSLAFGHPFGVLLFDQEQPPSR